MPDKVSKFRGERTLVDISLGVVGGLVLLVNDGILCSSCAGAERCVAVLGNRLVGLLRCLSTGALDGLSDVVGGVLLKEMLASVARVNVLVEIQAVDQVNLLKSSTSEDAAAKLKRMKNVP